MNANNAYPLSAEQLVIMFALLALLLWILTFLEDKADIAAIRDEIDARPPRVLGSGPKPR